MKKFLLLTVFSLFLAVGAFSEVPKYFAFEIASGGAYDVATGDIVVANGMGFTYAFNDTFLGGFSFSEIDGNSIDTINVTMVPVNNVSITMYTGQVDAVLGFGVGLGYDIFTNSKSLFTSLGLYADWFAGDGGSYDIANGGVFSLGVKTKIGL